MAINQDKPANVEVFKLAPGDIDHLFRRAGLTGNPLSAFRYNAEQAAVSSPSPLFKVLAESPAFRGVARQLLEPDVKISFHTGGSHAAEDRYYALLSKETGAVLAQFSNTEGNLLLFYFPDGKSFLDWWTGVYASPGLDAYPAVFGGGTLASEVLVCALHCVDLYRRFYMEGMLDYRGVVDVAIGSADFAQLLKRALASGDKRWLLPALFEITPGLKSMPVALKPEHLQKIEELGFITGKEAVFTLAERARLMGTEFIGAWLSATGWQATALIKGEERNLSRVFLAATALTNHLFSFESGPGGEGRFRHQPANVSELTGTLRQWLESLRQAAAVPADTGPAAAGAGAKRNFCGQCGGKISPAQKFCGQCGASL